jgi:hypothetical protein
MLIRNYNDIYWIYTLTDKNVGYTLIELTDLKTKFIFPKTRLQHLETTPRNNTLNLLPPQNSISNSVSQFLLHLESIKKLHFTCGNPRDSDRKPVILE